METKEIYDRPISEAEQKRRDEAMEIAKAYLQTLDEDMDTSEGRKARFDKWAKYPEILMIDCANLVLMGMDAKDKHDYNVLHIKKHGFELGIGTKG